MFKPRKNRNHPVAPAEVSDDAYWPARTDPESYVREHGGPGMSNSQFRREVRRIAEENKAFLEAKLARTPGRKVIVLAGMAAVRSETLQEQIDAKAAYADNGERAGTVAGYDAMAASEAINDAASAAREFSEDGPGVIAVIELENPEVEHTGRLAYLGDARHARVVGIFSPEQLIRKLPILGGMALRDPEFGVEPPMVYPEGVVPLHRPTE